MAFPHCVGLYRWLDKVSWLGKIVSVFWWVELYFFSLECNEVSSNELGDVNGFGVTLGSLILKFRAVFLCCWRICVVCVTLELVGPWVVLGFSVGMDRPEIHGLLFRTHRQRMLHAGGRSRLARHHRKSHQRHRPRPASHGQA